MHFNLADYIIIGVVTVSTIISLCRGFIKESLSLVIWVVDFWVAISYYEQFSKIFEPYIATKSIRLIISFAVIFIAVLIIGALFNYLFSQLIDKTGLTAIDRLFGVLFGFARGLVIVAIILLMISETGMAKDEWWKHSELIPHFNWLTSWLHDVLPKKMVDFNVESVVPPAPTMK